jgi:hypothetical protein
MFTHPDLVLTMAHDRQRELIAEADKERLLATARLVRRGRKAKQVLQAARGRPAGNLAACEPSAAVPAR